jgi:hypothetical protein
MKELVSNAAGASIRSPFTTLVIPCHPLPSRSILVAVRALKRDFNAGGASVQSGVGDMSPRQLRYFVAIGRAGSITRAAETLRIVLREMESALGGICDPEAIDALAKSDQRAMIERVGGPEIAATMGASGTTPAPKTGASDGH